MKVGISLFLLAFMATASAVVPKSAFTFNFHVATVKMSRMKEAKVLEAVDIVRQIFASDEFRRKVLHHRVGNKKMFRYNRGLTNQQIYSALLAGAERLHPKRNNAMDIELELYTDKKSNVIGYTFSRTSRIWMNTKFFNQYDAGKVAANLTHEWLHKLGFEHEEDPSPQRKDSVPYAIGYIVRDLAKKYQ